MTNYRCRTHPETPVSWKGTGCHHCDQAKHSRRDRRRRRTAREVADEVTVAFGNRQWTQ